jgi:hypothetical protein
MATKGSLTDRIIAKGKTSGRHALEVTEWGETVYAHEMSTRDAQEFASLAGEVEGGGEDAVKRNLAASVDLLMRCLKDDDGEMVFTTDAHRDFLMDQPVRLTARLVKDLVAKSGLTEEAEAVKNV